MPSRYKYTKLKTTKAGHRILKPTLYPHIPIEDSDLFVYPIYGDKLDTIAFRYYKDTSLWWIIAKANNIDKGVIGLDPNTQIRIPMDIEPILVKLKDMSY
tara:strand:- start:232 stop:531 length:300 start_codon:yes stop_codon:yes gene_type:complete